MLHGEIKVNDMVIGEWAAIRKVEHEGFCEYQCWLLYRDVKGYLQEAEWMLRGHAEFNGAVSLAARVLSEGMTKLKPAPVRNGTHPYRRNKNW